MTKLCDIVFPEGQQEGTESILANWLKRKGESVKLHEPIVEISTDKVMMELPSPGTGVIKEILKDQNQSIQPGDILGRIELSEAAVSAEPTRASKAPGGGSKDSAVQNLSPAVRKLIQEHKLDASLITGTGDGGRITHVDVMKFLEAKNASAGSSGIKGKRVPISAMRMSIANHMVHSLLHQAPHVTTAFSCDMTNALSHREKHKQEFERKGVNLTLTSYFVQAAVEGIKAVPEVNARFLGDSIELFEECNVGIATSIQDGLIVPVIHNAEKLDLFNIAGRLQDLVSRARDGKLDSRDVQKGTFTISNHGVSGSLFAAPIIINQPQSAILGIGKLEKRVVPELVNGRDEISIKACLYVTLTIDHRVLDGFKANHFLQTFVRSMESFK